MPFSQVTAGNLPASTGNLREAFIVRVGYIFSNLGTFLYRQYQKTCSKLPLAAFEIINKSFETDSVPKTLDCSLLLVESVIQKPQLAEKFFTLANLIDKQFLQNFYEFFHNYGVKEICQETLRFRADCRVKNRANFR